MIMAIALYILPPSWQNVFTSDHFDMPVAKCFKISDGLPKLWQNGTCQMFSRMIICHGRGKMRMAILPRPRQNDACKMILGMIIVQRPWQNDTCKIVPGMIILPRAWQNYTCEMVSGMIILPRPWQNDTCMGKYTSTHCSALARPECYLRVSGSCVHSVSEFVTRFGA